MEFCNQSISVAYIAQNPNDWLQRVKDPRIAAG
jgi:hypothetical protein